MSDFNVVHSEDLNSEHFNFNTPTQRIDVNLTVEKKPLFKTRYIWAEESAVLANNALEWAYGDAGTGVKGLMFDDGWFVTHLGFQADVFAANASVTIELISLNAASNNAANTIASLSLADATDGGGTTNNAYKYIELAQPVAIPAGIVGFVTRTVDGAVSDARVMADTQKQVGEYVADVFIGLPTNNANNAAPTLPAAAGKAVSDNFQDQEFNSFNLQVRNTTNAAISWEALIENVPYGTIPNLVAGDYALATSDNGDGTFNHLFTGTAQIAPFANISISAPSPVAPFGDGSGLSLYCA